MIHTDGKPTIANTRLVSNPALEAEEVVSMNTGPYYDPPDNLPGTVFDPWDETFGPIMSAIQSGNFEEARDLLDKLTREDS